MTRTRASLALVTVAATAAVALPSSPASAAPAKGLQDQEMTINHPDLRIKFLEDAEEANVKFLRFNTRWDGKSDKPDASQINAIRDTIALAPMYDIEQVLIAPTVTGGTSFNPKGKKRGPKASDKISTRAYKKYIRSVAKSFEDLPDVEMLYAPLNEPNWYRHIPKRGGATMYRRLHNIAYEEIKDIDADAKILFGELAPYARRLSKNYPHGQSTDPGDFVREVLGLKSNWKSKGKRKTYTVKADGVSLHTYDFKADPRKKRDDRDEWTMGNLGYAKSDLRKAARTKRLPSSAAKRIYVTEFAYKVSGSERISSSKARIYLKRAWKIAEKQKVKSFVWYQLRDPQSRDVQWQSGLKTKSGSSRKTWSTFRSLR